MQLSSTTHDEFFTPSYADISIYIYTYVYIYIYTYAFICLQYIWIYTYVIYTVQESILSNCNTSKVYRRPPPLPRPDHNSTTLQNFKIIIELYHVYIYISNWRSMTIMGFEGLTIIQSPNNLRFSSQRNTRLLCIDCTTNSKGAPNLPKAS